MRPGGQCCDYIPFPDRNDNLRQKIREVESLARECDDLRRQLEARKPITLSTNDGHALKVCGLRRADNGCVLYVCFTNDVNSLPFDVPPTVLLEVTQILLVREETEMERTLRPHGDITQAKIIETLKPQGGVLHRTNIISYFVNRF